MSTTTISNSAPSLIDEGAKLFTENHEPVQLNFLIASGGQGTVYNVTFHKKKYALKWYDQIDDDVIGGTQYKTILNIVGQGKSPSSKFIWPLFIVTKEGAKTGDRFGYLMELIPDNFHEMKFFLYNSNNKKSVQFKSFHSTLKSAMNLAMAMSELHLKGYSYKDLNPNNLAINPETGDVLIIDNDNVSVNDSPCSIKGTKGYMAPEIPRSNYSLSPSRSTDYYSLAVLLYRMFCVDHPMEGKLWDYMPVASDRNEEIMYSFKPLFHFDPNCDKNRPTDVYAPNARILWNYLPKELQDAFIRAFTVGINQPAMRIPEGEWIKILSRAHDKLIAVRSGADLHEAFVDFQKKKNIFPSCLCLNIQNRTIVLYPGKAIFQISIDNNYNNYNKVVAGIDYNKTYNCLMLHNLSNETWYSYVPGANNWQVLPPNGSAYLVPSTSIAFSQTIIATVTDPKNS